MSRVLNGQISSAQPRQLRYAHSSLDRNEDQCMVAATNPSVSVRLLQNRFYFLASQKTHELVVVPLRRDREDLLHQSAVLGCFERDVSEKRSNCAQPLVPAPRRHTAILLEMVQEAHHAIGVQISDPDCRWLFLQALVDILDQKPKSIAIGRDCVRARLPLAHESI